MSVRRFDLHDALMFWGIFAGNVVVLHSLIGIVRVTLYPI